MDEDKEEGSDFLKEIKLSSLLDSVFRKLVDDMGEKYGQFSLEHDHNYGTDRRSGWTVKFNGSVIVELCPSLDMAVHTAYFLLKDRYNLEKVQE